MIVLLTIIANDMAIKKMIIKTELLIFFFKAINNIQQGRKTIPKGLEIMVSRRKRPCIKSVRFDTSL
jgi:hypothetical protein